MTSDLRRPSHLTDEALDRLCDDVERRAGDALIGIGYHSGREWCAPYMREDFVAAHPAERREKIASNVILRGLTKEFEESTWRFGSLRYWVAAYDEATVLHVPFGPTEGVAVGIDPGSRDRLDAVVETCLEYRDALGDEDD